MNFFTQRYTNSLSPLNSFAVLMALVMLASGCGGGGGTIATTTPIQTGTGVMVTPVPAIIDVGTLADIEACPPSSGVRTETWYKNCLVGKRLPGKDPVTGESCELRLKAGGVFEYAKGGIVLVTTPPISQWTDSIGDYRNEVTISEQRLFGASLSGANPATNDIFAFYVFIRDSKRFPNEQTSNDDTVTFTWNTAGLSGNENCKLNNI
jgi:hypothetical protein